MTSTPKKARSGTSPYFSDIQLFRRVDKYLGNKDLTTENVSQDAMIDYLKATYKEYARRNKSAFRSAVTKAYEILKQTAIVANGDEEEYQIGMRPYEDDDDDDVVTDSQPDLQESTLHSINSTQNRSYFEDIQYMTGNRGPKKGPKSDVQDLINISSDEEEPKVDKGRMSTGYLILDPKKFPDINIRQAAVGTSQHPVPERNKKRKLVNSISLPNSKKRKEIIPDVIPELSFKDFGGYPKVLDTVNNLMLHFYQYEIFSALGVSPPRGFLLHGPPGCGKTYLAQCIAGELGLPLISVAAPELIGGMSGESEQRIRELFARAKDQVPCALFIDEIDAICQSRENARKEMEKRIVSQLIASFDELNECDEGNELVVIGATNRLEVIDPALRRAGRFDKEVCLGIPGRSAREGILKVMCSKVKLDKGVSFPKLAELTPGYVPADLKALIRESAIIAIKRFMSEVISKSPQTNGVIDLNTPVKPDNAETSEKAAGEEEAKPTEDNKADAQDDDVCEIIDEIPPDQDLISQINLAKTLNIKEVSKLSIEMGDIVVALKSVQPSAKREGFATVPDVTWDDIGSLQEIRDELKMSIMMPVKYPNEFSKMGIEAPSGILLCGPPGCGKTLLAKAVANEANINFISVKGPELLNMYVGESERAVRQCFQRAKNSQPCVIFFDEIDALCPKRSDSTEGSVSSRMVNQVLTEMDGVEGREGVFIMAATNRPDMVDPAVLRPGRFDKILYVGLPSSSDRVDILKAITKNGSKPPLSSEVSLEEIGSSSTCEGYSGADLAALVKEASVLALTEHINILESPSEYEMLPIETKELKVLPKHFTQAISKIRPSVTPKDQKKYESLRLFYGQPGKNGDPDTEMDIEN